MFWDCAQGLTDLSGKLVAGQETQDATEALKFIRAKAKEGGGRTVWVMRDLHKWLDGPIGIQTLRQLRNLARELPPLGVSIIVLAPSGNVPPELGGGDAVVMDWPKPDREEIGQVLDRTMKNGGERVEPLNGNRDIAIDAAIGLNSLEAEAAFAASLVKTRRIDPEMIAAEKKRVIARSGLLTWVEPLPGGLDAVGGLDSMKGWLMQRTIAYSPEARAYGLAIPKGVLVIGVSGCGKTFSAKATGTAWRCPIIRWDMGALRSKYVGESERNIREAQRTVESMGRVVLWIDEMDKAFAGSTGPQGDGGVASDALGAMLTWMNDRTNQAFIFATANDVEALPPELLRKGRWDEMFFVDLPTPIERAQIIEATTRSRGRDPVKLFGADGADEIASHCDKFTGAEVASLIDEAMFAAFADGAREITPADLIAAAGKVVPLVDSMPEKMQRLRAWSKRARPATSQEARTGPTGRVLDLG